MSQAPETAAPAATGDKRLPILLAMAMFVLGLFTSFRMMRQPDPVSSGVEGLVLG